MRGRFIAALSGAVLVTVMVASPASAAKPEVVVDEQFDEVFERSEDVFDDRLTRYRLLKDFLLEVADRHPSAKRDGSGIRCSGAREQAKKRRLAGAVRSYQSDAAGFLNEPAQIVEDLLTAEGE